MNQIQLKKNFKTIKTCRACDSYNITPFLDLGAVPLANNLSSQKNQKTIKAPLVLFYCEGCTCIQLGHTVDPKLLFSDYLYVSSTSQVFVDHFKGLAEEIKRFNPRLVVDIGSNDGVLLNQLYKLGVKAVGLESATNLCEIANKNGLETFNCWINDASTIPTTLENGADVVVGCNVFAHIEDIHNAIRNVSKILDPDGYFIIEVANVSDMLTKGSIDSIYHEHLFYYSLDSLRRLLSMHNFYLYKFGYVDTHGGSIRAIFKYLDRGSQSNNSNRVSFENVCEYSKLAKINIHILKASISSSTGKIIGFGAPAKATTLISVLKLDESTITAIIDDNPLKAYKYIPNTNIQIVPFSADLIESADTIIIFAWNFYESIMKRCKDNGFKGTFIVPNKGTFRSEI